MQVYLDNAASTPVYPQVIERISEVLLNHYGNPSSIHSWGRQAKVLVEDSRAIIADIINVPPSEIYFTSGASEACNTAIIGSVLNLGIKSIITSPIEHSAVLKAVEFVQKQYGIQVHWIPINHAGIPDYDNLYELLKNNPRSLLALMHVNNEIGNMLKVNKVREMCDECDAIFFSDTVQSIGKLRNDFTKLGFDMATCSAHKLHGPKGIGFLYLRDDKKIIPLITGGSQERNMRAGTENVALIAGMAKAFQLTFENMESDALHVSLLKNYFVEKLTQTIDGVEFNGKCNDDGIYHIVNVSFPYSKESELLHLNLDIEGIAVSAGSACVSGVGKSSHVIRYLKPESNAPTLRFSFSKYNTFEEIDFCITTIKRLLRK